MRSIKEMDKRLDEREQEIERLTLSYEDALEDLDKKENIIKEVREYIESYINQFNGVYPPVDMRYLDLNKLLDMLDKEK